MQFNCDLCRPLPGVQAHIPILETTDEGKQALLMGLEYLVNIAFVDDEEVRFEVSVLRLVQSNK